MKIAITILIIAGVVFGGYKLWEYWDTMKEGESRASTSSVVQVASDQLPGLPKELEPSFQQAQKNGPKAMKAWLDKTKSSRVVKDPRLAAIELDYVLMITKDDPIEAKRIFHDVKERTPPTSQIFDRIKQLEKTYE